MDEGMIRQIAAAWREAKRPVVFTGAGMSTESGLPDFRSARGLWKTRPESLATLDALRTMPDEFYFFYQWRIANVLGVEPNDGHKALARLESAGRLTTIITQNVDGLHQRAGSMDVIELHGTMSTVSCLDCHAAYPSSALLPAGETWREDYAAGRYRHGRECNCRSCGGPLRPDVVLFGEALPSGSWDRAVEVSRQSDFFVVIGSSLAVSPANLCPEIARESGAGLIIINQERTPLHGKANWCIDGSCGPALQAIADAMAV